MIKINLLGRAKVKAAKTKVRAVRGPSNALISLIMAISVIVVALGIVFSWNQVVSQKDNDLTKQIARAKKEKLRQENLLKENEVFEKRRKLLEARIDVIEALKKNQSGPVRILDSLSDCVQRTEGLWLRELQQKESLFTVNGLVMGSPNVIADFISSLEQVGKFKNVNLINVQEAESKYTFSITFEGEIIPKI
ncbi:MAG TPA: PilN domain-containing protein [Terriglobia bacterium]|nr:PilN domain-containing protein [Terriglobia bacterium]